MHKVLSILAKPALRRILAGAFSVGVFALALWVLHRAVGRFDPRQVLAAARDYPPAVLVTALIFSMGSYIALCGFDGLGLKHIGRPVPTGWIALISFVSHAISHNAGFAVLTGGSVRLRMYSAFGLGVAEVAGIVAFAGLAFALGTAALGSFAFVTEGDKVAHLLHIPPAVVTILGWLIIGILGTYIIWTGLARRPLAVGVWRFATPSLGMSFAQMAVAAIDLALVAGALYVLLPLKDISYPAFVGLYVVATLAGTLSHVPGGLGVFEGALVLMLPELDPRAVLAAMLIFRGFYNLLPLLLAATVLTVFEVVQRRRHVAEPGWLQALGPAMAAVVAFGAGAFLLFTGAVPPPSDLPRIVAEPAHLLAGGVGAVLLAVAWGILRQARWAHRIAAPCLALGAVLALLRGPDWITAAILIVGFAMVAAAGPLFREEGRPEPPFGWVGAGAAVVAAAAWLTLHSDGAGWRAGARLLSFVASDEPARAMRANLVALVALGAAFLAGRQLRARAAAAGRSTAARRPG